jgi:hypothetical protein
MIKFFRKIRQNMIKENKVSKYILYAFGEIILVVIGILIANEWRKDKEQIDLYLSNLIESINADVNTLQLVARHSEFRYKTLHHLLTITSNPAYNYIPLPEDFYRAVSEQSENTNLNDTYRKVPYPDTLNLEFLRLCINNSVYINSINVNSDVFQEMKSMGAFSKIEDEELKKTINGYYSFFEQNFVLADWNDDLMRSWRSLLRDHFNIVTNGVQFIGDPTSILDDPKGISRIQELVGPARFRANNAYLMIKQGQEIKQLIIQYLDRANQ